MPTFDTPHPISVHVDIVGDVRITASDRTDTVVTACARSTRQGRGCHRRPGDGVEHTDGALS